MPLWTAVFSGSPPRMRGKETPGGGTRMAARITPAYAGKSSGRQHRKFHSGDHPRVCGEKQHHVTVRAATLGSPPRMRGKVGIYKTFTHVDGITPAYAGKSWYRGQWCGRRLGSPPRMRGKALNSLNISPQYRITPAYAGKRFAGHLPAPALWDHPRVCGEKTGNRCA